MLVIMMMSTPLNSLDHPGVGALVVRAVGELVRGVQCNPPLNHPRIIGGLRHTPGNPGTERERERGRGCCMVYPTNNALLINFQLSSNAKILFIKTSFLNLFIWCKKRSIVLLHLGGCCCWFCHSLRQSCTLLFYPIWKFFLRCPPKCKFGWGCPTPWPPFFLLLFYLRKRSLMGLWTFRDPIRCICSCPNLVGPHVKLLALGPQTLSMGPLFSKARWCWYSSRLEPVVKITWRSGGGGVRGVFNSPSITNSGVLHGLIISPPSFLTGMKSMASLWYVKFSQEKW